MKANNRLLTPAQAARELNITVGALRLLAEAGRIKCEWTPGGHRRYREQVILNELVRMYPSTDDED